ncbi:MAG: lipoyl synthase [Peptococcaceae bacterium]|nr:lipoyl synthase [Peptococcaceae bacterium]
MPSRFPEWLKKKLPPGGDIQATRGLIGGLGLNTVCSSAMCPNLGECFARKTATFMILGDKCTRNCRFCAVEKGRPSPPDPAEPARVAGAVAALGLRHAVVTSVTRDDLPDGGASQFVETIRAIRERQPGTTVEVLTPDFGGRFKSIDAVAAARPEVYNHNLETVPRLYRRVRPGAGYRRSLALLERVKKKQPGVLTKSGLMAGLGEEFGEIKQVMADLRSAGCDIITIGQYLQPSPRHLEVREFVTPETFEALRQAALEMGFRQAVCGPFVRSSYRAGEVWG